MCGNFGGVEARPVAAYGVKVIWILLFAENEICGDAAYGEPCKYKWFSGRMIMSKFGDFNNSSIAHFKNPLNLMVQVYALYNVNPY